MPDLSHVSGPVLASDHDPDTEFEAMVPSNDSVPGFPSTDSCTVVAVSPLKLPETVYRPVCFAELVASKQALLAVVRLRFEPAMGDDIVGLPFAWFKVVVNT